MQSFFSSASSHPFWKLEPYHFRLGITIAISAPNSMLYASDPAPSISYQTLPPPSVISLIVNFKYLIILFAGTPLLRGFSDWWLEVLLSPPHHTDFLGQTAPNHTALTATLEFTSLNIFRHSPLLSSTPHQSILYPVTPVKPSWFIQLYMLRVLFIYASTCFSFFPS